MFLSCPAKKGTKEGVIGEALRWKAPSPMYPTRRISSPASKNLRSLSFVFRKHKWKDICYQKKRIQKCFRLGRERGLGGEWLGVGVEGLVYCCSIDRLRINALPPADFFGYFLVRRQESNTTAPQRFYTQKFLHNPCGMWKTFLWKNWS